MSSEMPSSATWTVGLAAVGAAGATMAYLYANKARGSLKIDPLVNLNDQTVEIQEGGRVCRAVKEGELVKYLYEDAQTLYQSFRRGAREAGGGECLGYRPIAADGTPGDYTWITYQDVITRSERFAAGLSAKGVPAGQEAFVGLYAQNSPRWIIAEQAAYVHSRVVVPLYDTLGPEASTYIINKMTMSVVLVDTVKKATSLLKQKPDCPGLKLVVVMEPPTEALCAEAKTVGLEIVSMDEMEEIGARVAGRYPDQPPSPADLATVCFTSGTTGTPKGVMLTHGNVIADCTPFAYLKYGKIFPDDVLMSFLPLAHMFERVCEAVMYMHGAKVGFYRGDVKLLTEDIKALRPTFLVVVPRLLNRIYDKVIGEASKSGIKKRLVDWAISSKDSYLKKSIVRNDTIWDHIVFKKVREAMGGRVKLMISGSAPLADNVMTFMRAALGCLVLEGYGQTECVAAATLSLEGDHLPGQVGVPIPCCAIKLDDVPDMKYFAKEGKGEICIRGYNVSPGYFKEPEKTAETFDEDGWLHTGDIGTWTPNGQLKIIDRKKHIFKLAQGEYIAPEKIENVYASSKFVAQVFVHGESLKACLVAIVVPDFDVLTPLAQKDFGLPAKPEAIAADSRVKKLILDDILKIGKDKGLHSFEQVKDILISSELWTVENNLLTPTFKSKRPELRAHFKDAIEGMYASLI